METDNTYNGWTNWATWHVALLIDNTQSTQQRQFQMAQHELKFKAKGTFNLDRAARWWKKEFTAAARETKQFASDTRNETADEINWHEIAESAIQEAELDAAA